MPAVVHRSARAAQRRDERHLLVPLQARLRGPSLDRQLADGVASWRSPVHAARACRLTGTRSRRCIARALERLVADAEQPPSISRAMLVLPARASVREARPLLVGLASRLRADAPVDARGMAALRLLLTDGGGPIYDRGDPEALRRRLEIIEPWLAIIE